MTTKFKTYCVTHRFREGITESQITKFANYLKKKCDYYYLITEKDGVERHLHFCFICKLSVSRSALTMEVTRLFPELDVDEKKVLLRGIKVWNNRDFLDYMEKGDGTVIIEKNLSEVGFLEQYFPVTDIVIPSKKLQNYVLMERLETLWKNHVPSHWSINTENV